MATIRSAERPVLSAADTQLARVASNGCARHPHLQILVEATGRDAGRDLSDAVHLLCGLHGHYPGLIEIALQRCPSGAPQQWLTRASEAFERERLYLVRLTSAVGPLPSTPGAAETEASLQGARRALEMLAQSERQGCALGSATALIGDWWPIRRVLDRAGARAGVPTPPPSLPDEASVVHVIESLATSPATARALSFGAEQLLLQHRALFDLLEARAEARSDY
ncbi:hypothetical protein [Sphingomonas sp.]|uniref:DUF6975 family protein n=1 Tax=Sphingomonas sp. TaxID=28214 RepID=UPI0025D498EB|nr:hypothetical protein [Sphingomonas sp.]MBV9529435.1 hypothetical protein [Sphingomonas sp.]